MSYFSSCCDQILDHKLDLPVQVEVQIVSGNFSLSLPFFTPPTHTRTRCLPPPSPLDTHTICHTHTNSPPTPPPKVKLVEEQVSQHTSARDWGGLETNPLTRNSHVGKCSIIARAPPPPPPRRRVHQQGLHCVRKCTGRAAKHGHTGNHYFSQSCPRRTVHCTLALDTDHDTVTAEVSIHILHLTSFSFPPPTPHPSSAPSRCVNGTRSSPLRAACLPLSLALFSALT